MIIAIKALKIEFKEFQIIRTKNNFKYENNIKTKNEISS